MPSTFANKPFNVPLAGLEIELLKERIEEMDNKLKRDIDEQTTAWAESLKSIKREIKREKDTVLLE